MTTAKLKWSRNINIKIPVQSFLRYRQLPSLFAGGCTCKPCPDTVHIAKCQGEEKSCAWVFLVGKSSIGSFEIKSFWSIDDKYMLWHKKNSWFIISTSSSLQSAFGLWFWNFNLITWYLFFTHWVNFFFQITS